MDRRWPSPSQATWGAPFGRTRRAQILVRSQSSDFAFGPWLRGGARTNGPSDPLRRRLNPFVPPIALLAPALLARQSFDSRTLAREIVFVGPSSTAIRKDGAFMDAEAAAPLLNAECRFDAKTGEVRIVGRGHRVALRLGSRTLTIDGRTKVSVAKPYARSGGAMIPFRPVAQALGQTVEYEKATDSLLLPRPGRRLLSVPLASRRPGIVVVGVDRGRGRGGSYRLQIQANVPDGEIIVRALDSQGGTLQEGKGPGFGGLYGETIVFMGETKDSVDVIPASIAVFARRPDGTTTKPLTVRMPQPG